MNNCWLAHFIKPFFFYLLLAAPFIASTQKNGSTEILWDNYGVPHISAKKATGMYYAFGWAQMTSHANLILQLFGQSRGRGAEYFGKDNVSNDRLILLFDLPGKGSSAYQKQKPEFKSYIDAFVKGMNDYATAHPEAISPSVKSILPVTGPDIFTHILWVSYRFLSNNERNATENLLQAGSNAYAIGPSRTTSHHAMLVTNPHLPWKPDITMFFEAHLQSDGFNAYGVSLVGMPMLFLAFNNDLGWTHTVNTLDASDRYELSLKDGGYLLDGQVQPFETINRKIRVKQEDRTLKEQQLSFRYAKQGPVIGERGDKAYAIRIAGLEDAGIFEEYHRMAKATDFGSFEAAVKMMQIPMFNIIYADRKGNIYYVFNGNVPKRPEGNFQFWRRTVNGSQSKLIWQETLPYEVLPKVLNPPTGFLQNANDPPWTCTYPMVLDPKDFPAYMAPRHMRFRPQRATNMIRNDSSISFEDLVNYKMNTGVEAADRFLDDLFAAVEKYPDTTAQRAVIVLKAWDRKTDSGSKGAILFFEWFDHIDTAMWAVPWKPAEPVTTPDGLKNEKQAVDLLVRAVHTVEKDFGSIDRSWGSLYRLQMNGMDYPSNGGPEQYGIFRSISYEEGKDHRFIADGGETYIAVTEFGSEVKASVLLCYGNATQPGNKHAGDQLKMTSEKKLRPALLKREEIMKHLEKREVLDK
jgi:acyl-homoserine-lactone acylase